MKQPLLIITIFCALLLLSGSGFGAGGAAAPPDAKARQVLNRAYRLINQGEIKSAIEVLEAARQQRRSSSVYILHTLGSCYQRQGTMEKALATFLSCTSTAPDYAPGWSSLGHAYYAAGNFKEAANSFLKSYDAGHQKTPAALYQSCCALYQAGEADQAQALFKRLRQRHPDQLEPGWTGLLARIYLDQNRPEKALPILQKLAKTTIGSEQKKWQAMLLYQYIRLDQTETALSLAKTFTHDDPLAPEWWQALSHIQAQRGNYGQAVAALTIKGFLLPLSASERESLADLNLAAGIPSEAVTVYQQLFGEDKNYRTVKQIIHSCLLLHQQDEALHWLQAGLDLQPEPELFLLRGNLLYQQKEYAQAIKDYEMVVQQDKKSGEAWLSLGYASLQAGDQSRAVSAFKQARQFKKQVKQADQALEYLALTASRKDDPGSPIQ